MGCLELLIHPALMKGLGVSLLQAAAAGIPIVGKSVGGIPEILRDGLNYYLVPARDVPALEKAIMKILRDRALAKRMGDSGRKIVEEDFSIESMVEGNLEIYRGVMGERQ
jgi:glycosyltransferase involved in cell wall biosynthesis